MPQCNYIFRVNEVAKVDDIAQWQCNSLTNRGVVQMNLVQGPDANRANRFKYTILCLRSVIQRHAKLVGF